RFHHLVGTVDTLSHMATFYMDGVPRSNATWTSLASLNPGTAPIKIGFNYTNWNGKVDEVAIYDHVLAADRVVAHYRAGIAANGIVDVTVPGVSNLYSQKVWIAAPNGTSPSQALQDTAAD